MPRIEDTSTIYEDKCACPECNAVLDAATGKDKGVSPSVGDFSICVYCGSILQFVEPLPSMAKLTKEEWEALDDETRAWLKRASEGATGISRAYDFMKHFGVSDDSDEE